MILDLTVQLNQTRQELDSAKNELEVLSTKNKDEIIMTIYEVNAIGLSDQAKNEYFMTKFGFSYEQATEILNYLSKTDDFDIASQALFFSDYETSIYHFDLALIKDPGNMNSKIGKIVALNGLGRTNESRSIAREIESTYSDKKFLYKLLGDSYCAESNFSECSDYYIRATGMYLNETPTDISSLSLVMDICEIRYLGLYNSSYVTVLGPDTDGWKVCDIDLIDLGQTVMIRYKTDN